MHIWLQRFNIYLMSITYDISFCDKTVAYENVQQSIVTLVCKV